MMPMKERWRRLRWMLPWEGGVLREEEEREGRRVVPSLERKIREFDLECINVRSHICIIACLYPPHFLPPMHAERASDVPRNPLLCLGTPADQDRVLRVDAGERNQSKFFTQHTIVRLHVGV